jgi:DNA-binding NtrC family response regulator
MQPETPVVLVVDRESETTRALITFLRARGLEVVWARDGESAFTALDQTPVDCLVTELRAQRIDGMTLLRRAREKNHEVCAIVMTERPGIEMAVEAMRQGAADFQVKPLNLEKLLAVIRHGLEHQALAARVAEMEAQLDARFGYEALTGRSRSLQRVLEQVRHIAPTRATVLIEGETGTGKGLLAQAIHQNSPRKGERFVWVSCGALVPEAIEGELFGLEPGAFAGSGPQKPAAATAAGSPGRFEQADGGTLFLDEVGELPPSAQVRLLRVLQDRSFERAGGTGTLRADVRLIAATSRDLTPDVQAGRFRADLYERLSVVRVQTPPLRERREDIPLLVEAFLREFNREHGRRVTGITRGALERLMRHPWPGNVRELKNTLEGMVVFAQGRRALDLSDLPDPLREAESAGERLELAVGMTVEEAERRLIAATLSHAGFDKPRAAAMLGIGLRTLYRKIKQYALH